MFHVSLTRLRLRSAWLLPAFFLYALQAERQARRSSGFAQGALLPDRRYTFWTVTVWDSRESMLAFMTTGSHRRAMPKLTRWCDQASVAHWDQPSDGLPELAEVERRMRSEGRASKVSHPAPGHADLAFEAMDVRIIRRVTKL